MTTSSEISRTYARVLFDLATAVDDVDGADRSLTLMLETVESNRELKDVLSDESMAPDRKRAIMQELFAPVASPEAVSIATTAIERGNLELMNAIASDYREIAERILQFAIALDGLDDERDTLVGAVDVVDRRGEVEEDPCVGPADLAASCH